MSTSHSPLPPTMPATLDTVSAKLDHVITIAELTANRVEQVDARVVQVERAGESMRKVALRLSAASIALATSRAIAAVAAPTRSLAVMAAGAFAGGFIGTILWQLTHAHTALASWMP